MKQRPIPASALDARITLLIGRIRGNQTDIDIAYKIAETIGMIDGSSCTKPHPFIAAEPYLYEAWRKGIIKDRATEIWREEEIKKFATSPCSSDSSFSKVSFLHCLYLAEKSLKEI